MAWTEEKLSQLPVKKGFRIRGLEITRLETFIDAAFAFATTMLVISIGDIPNSYEELIYALKGTPAFAMSFAAIMIFWSGHRRWSRRYGLEDGTTLIVSLSLIFIMLVYVYPLKLMFSALASWASGGWFPSEFRLTSASEMTYLFVIYGFGFAGLTFIMLLLHWHAKKLKDKLGLNQLELTFTNSELTFWSVLCLTGLASGLFALIMPAKIAIFAGFFYFNLPVSMNIVSIIYKKKIRKLGS